MVILPSEFDNKETEGDTEVNNLIKTSNKADASSRTKGMLVLVFALFVVIIASLVVVLYKPKVVSPDLQGGDNILNPGSKAPYSGKADAAIELIAVYDPFCAGCGWFYHEVETQIKTKYIDTGLIKFYFWPQLLSENSQKNYEAMECANEQNRYWEFRAALIGPPQLEETWSNFQRENYIKVAQTTGINNANFISCLDSGRYTEYIKTLDEQWRSAGIKINPSVVIGDKILESPRASDIFTILDRKLAL